MKYAPEYISMLFSSETSVINDEPDNRFLELAAASNADFIITGNSNDFIMSEFKNTKIVSPKEFWDLHV